MAYQISDQCTTCGTCVNDFECPADAIKEGDAQFTISDDCISCGQCVDICPVSAISEG